VTQAPRRRRRERQLEWRAEMTVIVRTIIRSLLPIVLVFGAYIISYGHLTPGGGFQGGMILVGAVMCVYLAYGYDAVRRIEDEDLDLAEHLGALMYVVVGLAALSLGAPFLTNVLPAGPVGSLASGGIVLVLNVVVGFKVAAGTLIVLLILLEALRKGA
jgi:multisubunit Na+/H+ antiporter MnhB subunit